MENEFTKFDTTASPIVNEVFPTGSRSFLHRILIVSRNPPRSHESTSQSNCAPRSWSPLRIGSGAVCGSLRASVTIAASKRSIDLGYPILLLHTPVLCNSWGFSVTARCTVRPQGHSVAARNPARSPAKPSPPTGAASQSETERYFSHVAPRQILIFL